MHNWLELFLMGQDKVAEAVRSAAEARRGRAEASARRSARPTTLIVERGEVLTVRVRRGELLVMCLTGRLWVTNDRCPNDVLLVPGESVTYHACGTVVLESLRKSTLRLIHQEEVRVAAGSPLRAAILIG
jgi:hypothetical protein